MEDVEIIKVTGGDIAELQEISIQTFYETFSFYNSAENMKAYMENSFSERRITEELADKNSEFYFAILGGKVIGYLKVNFGKSQTELGYENSVELERIYVLKEFHGKKIGQILYEKAIDIARHRKADFIWLGVWEKNLRAIAFYQKNGFKAFNKHIFMLGDDAQTDIMMKLVLTQNQNNPV